MSRDNVRRLADYNKSRGTRFRGDVVDFLRKAGHHTATALAPSTLSEALRAPGDIEGVPFVLAVRTSQRMDISSLLDEAASAADYRERQWYAAVHNRRGRPVDQQYVVLDLATFAELMHHVPAEA